MAIRFSCACGKEMQAQDEYAGRKTRCPDCSSELVIPAVTTKLPRKPTPAPRTLAGRRSREENDYDDRPARRRVEAKTSGMAVWCLILGFLSLGCSALTGLPAADAPAEGPVSQVAQE